MKESVLITGASGFVGYHLIEEALAKGLEVYAAVRASSRVDHLRNLPVQFVTTDFSDVRAIRAELEAKRYQYVIHAAGATKALNEASYNEVNAVYTRNLAQAVSELQVPLKKFVFLSSLAAMGPAKNGHPILEKDAPNPVTFYGKSKLLAESYLSALDSLPTIVLRPTAVYGPRDRDIFIILKTIAQGIEPYIGRKPQQLSFIYVKDLAAVSVGALYSSVVKGSYNVSDGGSYDRYELANITKEILHKKTLKVHIPMGVVKAMAFVQETLGRMQGSMPALNQDKLAELTAANWSCSIDSIRKDLGFSPRYTLAQGLEETIQWYKANQWL
ncbi:Nucleoside-diphosphate-sugar epimerase [Chryseolinea serpens]|uniref:Nucleoside-diphosphate-sugar epimerase n=1 Tax=Chryseolinea serpens TaxID=947013 RepID=A0A1M5UTR1_9BACT|nr:NAD(P)-dependent oxidoreductase [Chryseolinea serpens]SHH66325.1 Nucleoside-diphosphate-sugar epimerase [Chryseolinea serpens]